MKHHRTVSWITRGYLICEAILYISFLICDVFSYPILSSRLKYSSILLCFIFTISLFHYVSKRQDAALLSIAFFFTAVSDYFLLFTTDYVYGIISFCMVQILYMLRIWSLDQRKHPVTLIIRGCVIAATIMILSLVGIPIDPLLCVTCFYFLNFLINIIELINRSRQSTKCENNLFHNGCFLIGMLLFFLCDIFVGLFNLTSYITVEESIYRVIELIASYGMWIFYLPGQVLIALSTKRQ